MNISLLVNDQVWGGLETHLADLAEVLADRGHTVVVAALGKNLFSRLTGRKATLQVLHLPLTRPLRDLGFRESLALFRRLIGDVAVFSKTSYTSGNWRFHLAARICFPRYLTIEQNVSEAVPTKTSRRHWYGLVPGIGLWWYKLQWDYYLRSMGPHQTICVSYAVRDRLIRDYRFPSRKTLTIHNGTDPTQFRPSAEHRRAARAAWQIPESAFVFGSAARLERQQKGQDLAIGLFAKLVAHYPNEDVRLVLVGQGPDEAFLKDAVRRAGLAGRVCFPGFSSHPCEAYCGFDAFLMPSRSEGLPLALVEAMACGCCPIAMGVGGVPEVITNPSLGWLVVPGDTEGFMAAMREVLQTSPEQRLEIGRQARGLVLSHFDARTQLAALADVIEQGPGLHHKLAAGVPLAG